MGSTRKNKWRIALRKNEGDIFSTEGFSFIEPPYGMYHADPFLWGEDIFFEDYDYKKGIISVMKIGEFAPIPVIENEYHMSFPFLIEDKGEIYMIPETGIAQRIEAYRATEFPYKWEKAGTLVEGVCAGDTVVHRNGK